MALIEQCPVNLVFNNLKGRQLKKDITCSPRAIWLYFSVEQFQFPHPHQVCLVEGNLEDLSIFQIHKEAQRIFCKFLEVR